MAFQQFNQNQVEELITRFKPDIWWGDGGHGASLERIIASTIVTEALRVATTLPRRFPWSVCKHLLGGNFTFNAER